MSQSRNASDRGAAVRFNKWWRGYQKGQVARFDTSTARQLVDKGFATSYRPTKEESERDAALADARERSMEENMLIRQGAILARQGAFAQVEK
ncbi:hypothetical protein [Kozakia baliensis]|uniref:Uncharacterized protein n=1 Tax=Kozakia baliensis TaxID=153496 RepID=A0A1D8UTY4_9PROT|nr:hypothetical protein [Kozakia baliensis]AOX16927.1 hypothetical protein A0U89_07015 [Kozakia baliensis]GBR25559.1 hypothetical protein AA0488_0682 [Kozakia baliensis NRIC 0488]GEL64025.1 hypothetical protein KBA01_13110 [Kozakia baliensis]